MTETKCQYIYYKYLLYVPGVDKFSHFSRRNNIVHLAFQWRIGFSFVFPFPLDPDLLGIYGVITYLDCGKKLFMFTQFY